MTAPDFSQTKPLDECLDLEDSVFESQFDSARGSTNMLNKSSSRVSLYSSVNQDSAAIIRPINRSHKMMKIIGIAIPPDVFNFLRVQHIPKSSKLTKIDRIGRIYPNVDGGVSHLVKEC